MKVITKTGIEIVYSTDTFYVRSGKDLEAFKRQLEAMRQIYNLAGNHQLVLPDGITIEGLYDTDERNELNLSCMADVEEMLELITQL